MRPIVFDREYICNSVDETIALAYAVAETLQPGSLVALNGDLGTGKTVFARALCRALDVPETVPITSPTYSVVNSYVGRWPIHHFDVYRLSDIDELEAVGFRDFVTSDATAIVEWAERVASALPAQYIDVLIRDGVSEHQRVIVVMKRSPEPQKAVSS
ncbi:MAG: tRNA (adenosine(37)-N6)-threonylcarbamoyltransferase complex ATPase subunit type 1 TsaE [Myxococcota bacterium]|nr:tRNA (adenosine(37)-N6)-threonylcarbamoyltransferase complex ATPase subunit type 1 TsaE [Myxococcota bacterium]